MKCKNCGTELENNAKFCAVCGNKVEYEPEVPPAEEKLAHDISAIWPEWQIEKQLGRGSYGVVYQAKRSDNNVESQAAIKIISIPSDCSEVDSLRSEGLDMDGTRTYFKGIVDDFVSEIQLMESLKGIQNIVSVEDYKVVEKTDTVGWDIYIRMELLTPFNTYVCDKTLSETDVIKLGRDICTALEICGQRNIIHRDIKPENIFINDFGHFKLGDFGIARKLENMTGGLSQKGTFNYMAPEIANGTEYDARVDVYSLGIVLYRLLNNNKLPFLNTEKQLLNPNERKLAVERRMRGDALPAPCNASPAMANLILRACAYNPQQRFSSATEMKNAIISVANGTYKNVEVSEDKTTSVRPAENKYDATTSVRKASGSAKQSQTPKVDAFEKNSKDKNKKSKKPKVIGISILVGIIALFVTIAVLFFTSPAYEVYQNINADEFDNAVATYDYEVKDNFLQKKILGMLLGERANDVATDFKNQEIAYTDAVAELETLNKMNFSDAKEKIDELKIINDADNALEKADKYYQNSDYGNAITEYSKIPETDENYEKAQNKINEIYPQYIDSVIKKADEYGDSGDFREAVSHINSAYGVLPKNVNTSKLDEAKKKHLEAYELDVADDVVRLKKGSQWSEAFSAIDEALTFDDNEYFQKLKVDTQNEYIDSVEKAVEKYMDEEDYLSAKRVADDSLTVLPANAELKDLKENVDNNTPTYLLDVSSPYSQSGYSEPEDGESFSMGGQHYTNGFMLESSEYDDKYYAIFNIDAKYKTLSFSAGHIDETGNADVDVKIYFEGKWNKTYTIKGEDLPKRISIDVTGVKSIKIETSEATDYGAKIGFGNITVK